MDAKEPAAGRSKRRRLGRGLSSLISTPVEVEVVDMVLKTHQLELELLLQEEVELVQIAQVQRVMRRLLLLVGAEAVERHPAGWVRRRERSNRSDSAQNPSSSRRSTSRAFDPSAAPIYPSSSSASRRRAARA